MENGASRKVLHYRSITDQTLPSPAPFSSVISWRLNLRWLCALVWDINVNDVPKAGAQYQSGSSTGNWESAWLQCHGGHMDSSRAFRELLLLGCDRPWGMAVRGFSLCPCLPSYQFCEPLILPKEKILFLTNENQNPYCFQVRTLT